MTWRWWHKQDPSLIRLDQRNEQQAAEEAQQAREAAEQRFEETKRLDAEVSAVSALLKRLRRDNNFGALIEQSMRRRR
jgi:hypothetical protein